MVKHLVFFQFADMAQGNTKQQTMLLVKEQLESLKGVIPEIRKIAVHLNHPQAPSGNFDVVLDSEFDSLGDLQVYIDHPAHQKVAAFIAKVKVARAAVDYEF